MKVLIDADSIVYRAGFAAKGQPLHASLGNAHKIISGIQSDVGSTDVICYLSGAGNFRDDIAVTTPYKGTRPSIRPEFYEEIRTWINDNYPTIHSVGCEADDLVAMDLTGFISDDKEVVAASIDKDLLQVPGLHWNWVKKTWEFITPEQGWYNLHYQIIMGDRTDNIPGLPGVGPVKAAKWLSTPYDPQVAACKAYGYELSSMAYPDVYVYFLEQANLVYLKRRVSDSYELLFDDFLSNVYL